MNDRSKFIGASEVSAILNANPFMTPLMLWSLKTGKITQQEETEPQYWGKKKERIVSERFEEDHNVKLMAYKKRFVHKTMPYFSCELDNIIVGTDEIVECKSVNEYQWKAWKDANIFPDYIKYQITAQMGLSGRKKVWVACLCGASNYIEKEFDFDPELWAVIQDKVRDFWENYVMTNIPPIAVGNDNEIIVEIYPSAGPEIKEASQDISDAIAQLQLTKAEIISLEKIKDDLEAKIKMVIGDAAGIKTPEFLVKWNNVKGSTYTVVKKDSRQLRVTKNKEN